MIWQVLNLLAPTKEMPASGIHHCVLYTHTHIISYLFTFSRKKKKSAGSTGAHDNTLLLN